MERLFSPCTRLHDILSQRRLEEVRRLNAWPLQELNLNVSTEELLSAETAFAYVDLHAMLGNEDTVAWLTPHAAVFRGGGRAMRYWDMLHRSHRLHCSADGKDVFAVAFSYEHLVEICDIVVRLLAVSAVHSLILNGWRYRDVALINALTLEDLMEHCRSLKVLTLVTLALDEDHCRVLGAYSRPDLEIVLECCKFTDAGRATALAEVLGRNQGPTKLDGCEIDNVVLANGLHGNSRLISLKPRFSDELEVRNRQVLAIAGALRENKGLVDLNLSWGLRENDVTWAAICDSLKAHPTLEVLDLRATSVPVVVLSWIQPLLDMMKVNTSIQTIRLHACYGQHKLYRESVIPYLETNRLRPRLLAIQQARPIPYRAKVLGRALLAARTDANSLWMLLSGNTEVAFPSTTATIITTAASLPTSATAAATSNVAPIWCCCF
jgi:hypothetical protein